jgi:hypothetical protein
MRLFLNEQEVIDGVCVFTANRNNGIPEDVEVKEIDFHKNGTFSAVAMIYGDRQRLDTQDIINGVAEFLEEYHCFNPEVMNVKINFSEHEGVFAEVFINE